MKKLISLLLALVLGLSLVACDTEEKDSKERTSPKEAEYKEANTAYCNLAESHELCVEVMDSLYGAWFFAIYKADDYSSFYSCLDAFCDESNLDYNEAEAALTSFLQSAGRSNASSSLKLACLQDMDIAINLVTTVYQDNGTYDKIDDNISNAKTALKSVSDDYSDYTGYPILKAYYSEISAYAEFCKSPTGSFEQLKTTIDTYETNLRNYKNDLSFIFD